MIQKPVLSFKTMFFAKQKNGCATSVPQADFKKEKNIILF